MLKWCKIIETLDNQVLFFIEPEEKNQENCESLHQMVRVRGVCADIKLEGIPQEDCERVFDSIDERIAEQVVKTVEDLMEREKA